MENNIPNQELVKQLYQTYKDTNIQFMHVYAHTNKKIFIQLEIQWQIN